MTTDTSQPELTVLSYGAGQDSTTMLYLYIHDPSFRVKYAPGRFLVVFADTGDEHPHTYEHIKYTKELCKEHGIEFVQIVPEMGFHTDTWQSLREAYRKTSTVGSKCFMKTCTDNLKIKPLYKFLESWVSKEYGTACGRKKGLKQFAETRGKIRVLIGIARGEEKRIPKVDKRPKWQQQTIEAAYPLVDLGLDRMGCQAYMRSIDRPIPFPSNCMLCPFMSEAELLWLYRNHPLDYFDWVQIERNKMDAWEDRTAPGKNYGVWGSRTLPEMLLSALDKYGDWTKGQLHHYKMTHGCTSNKM